MPKITHGKLTWIPINGKKEVVAENMPFSLLQEKKRELIRMMPHYYGNKKMGILKIQYLWS